MLYNNEVVTTTPPDTAAVAAVLIVFMAIGAVMYLLPAIVALARRHRNKGAIVALNFLLGWTFFGWVGAFVWSLTSNTEVSK